MQNTNIKRLVYKLKTHYLSMNNIVLILALLIAAGWAWGSLNMMSRNYQLQRNLGDKKRQLALMEIEVDNKRLEQKYYKTNEFLEISARENLGLAKAGEKILILDPPSKEIQLKANNEKRKENARTDFKKDSNMDQWVNFLFGGNKGA